MTASKAGIGKRLGQGAVVVSSILIAFAVDAVWEESKERRDLNEDLANIALELEENRARVVYHLDLAQRIANALDVLYLAIDTGGPSPLVADTTSWLANITPTLDASLGAIDALIASGRMAVVDNPELSRRLVEATQLFRIGVSFGSVASLISLPCAMSHASIPAAVRAARRLPEHLVRLSIGLEEADDLIEDLDAALRLASAA